MGFFGKDLNIHIPPPEDFLCTHHLIYVNQKYAIVLLLQILGCCKVGPLKIITMISIQFYSSFLFFFMRSICVIHPLPFSFLNKCLIAITLLQPPDAGYVTPSLVCYASINLSDLFIENGTSVDG